MTDDAKRGEPGGRPSARRCHGLLPETYDSDTGAWLARHWFAWPSAVLAALALGSVG
jgi:hypothetical protein